MKVKTVIENRFEKAKSKKPINQLIIAILFLVQLIYNTIFPFALGVYFAQTKHLFFIILMIFPIFFSVRIKINKDNEIDFEIVRGI